MTDAERVRALLNELGLAHLPEAAFRASQVRGCYALLWGAARRRIVPKLVPGYRQWTEVRVEAVTIQDAVSVYMDRYEPARVRSGQ